MAVRALVFDVFGTVVDWRSSLIDDLSAWGRKRGLDGDWTGLVDAWRGAYKPSMDEVRAHPERGFVVLEDLQRASLERLAPRFGLPDLSDDDLDHINMGWRRLKPWPDSVAGLTRLKSCFLIAPLSNGNFALTAGMAKQAGLPWDVVFGTDLFGHYKPDPDVYLGAARLLRLSPSDLMMVAAHNGDLKAAQDLG
ncbi:MAG: haloacid dehalogenase type II, partial [Proteobacteria bacterium]